MDAQACLRLLLFACNKVGFSSDEAHFILDVSVLCPDIQIFYA